MGRERRWQGKNSCTYRNVSWEIIKIKNIFKNKIIMIKNDKFKYSISLMKTESMKWLLRAKGTVKGELLFGMY